MNSLTRKSLRLGSRIFRKAGINPVVIADIIGFLPHRKIKTTNEDVALATHLISGVHGDCDNSAVIPEKDVSTEYDLQIIIPAYNVEKFIVRCMESAIATQEKGYRVLITVVNDGSTDDTPELLKQYEGREDIEIIHQENRGFSGARNRGLENIRGRYVTFLDSDDELGDIISILQEAIKADADIAEGSFERFNDTSATYIKGNETDSDKGGYGILYGFPWGKVFKSHLFKRVRFPESYWFEDTICGMILFHLAKKVVKRDIPAYRYRINPNGISRNYEGKAKTCDTHWITARLMKDRELLGIDNDTPVAARMLAEQIGRNYFRISKMQRNDLDRALFILSRELYSSYIKEDTPNDHPIAAALIAGDYLKFRVLSTILS